MIAIPISQTATVAPARRARISCSHCGSGDIYRTQPRGLIERHIHRAFHFVPFWCEACDRRFYVHMKASRAKEKALTFPKLQRQFEALVEKRITKLDSAE
jgi:ribosomal protein L33